MKRFCGSKVAPGRLEDQASATNERGPLQWPTTRRDEQLPAATTDVAKPLVLVDQAEFVPANSHAPKQVLHKPGDESQSY